MRVLLTGAGGFVGNFVAAELLSREHGVIGVRRPRDPRSGEGVLDGIQIYECDLSSDSDVRNMVADVKPDAAIHLAWYTVPGQYWSSPENLECVSQSLMLARCLADNGCRRFIGAGTCAEYDWAYNTHNESKTPCKPSTLYGTAKHSLYMLLEKYCEGTPMAFAWARYYFLFGPGEQKGRLFPTVIRRLLSGRDVNCTSGEQARDFVFVKDAACATVTMLESSVVGPVNIGYGNAVSVRRAVEKIWALIPGDAKPVFGAIQTPPNEPLVLEADTRRLVNEVGYSPSYGLDEGIRLTVCSYAEEGNQDV